MIDGVLVELTPQALPANTETEEFRGYWQGPYSLNNPNVPFSAFWGDGGSTSAGITVSESTALTYASFYSAVALISGDASTLPLHLLPAGIERRPSAHHEPSARTGP